LIPQDVTIEEADIVLTSGLGGGYPADLIIGQVVNIQKREAELFQHASVQPVVDFTRLEIVLIITNFRPVEIGPLIPTPAP
jgi:rod shape-determining protein MreC